MFLFSLHFVFEMTTESYITRVIIILILKHIISQHFHRARVLNSSILDFIFLMWLVTNTDTDHSF